MENAAKALIIAGAILISILLISVGILVMNSTGDVQQGMQEQMDSTAIETFNSKFTNYVGTKSATVARSLCSAVIASNASSANQVSVNGKTTSTDISAIAAGLETKNNYTISISDNDGNGYYDTITITVKGSTGGTTTTNP